MVKKSSQQQEDLTKYLVQLFGETIAKWGFTEEQLRFCIEKKRIPRLPKKNVAFCSNASHFSIVEACGKSIVDSAGIVTNSFEGSIPTTWRLALIKKIDGSLEILLEKAGIPIEKKKIDITTKLRTI